MTRLPGLLALLLAAACADPGKGAEADADFGSKADGFFTPTEHGALAANTSADAMMDQAHRFHAWTFTLADRADVALDVSTGAGGAELDTVLYLYQKRADGTFGKALARNDDASASTQFSALHQPLDAGSYRIIVKGFHKTEAGPFKVSYGCTGKGCVGPLSFDLPIVDENGEGLYSRFNPKLTAAGLEPAPDLLAVTGDDAGRTAFTALTDRLEAAGTQLDLPLVMRFATPNDYAATGPSGPLAMCYRGAAADVADGLASLTDNVLSDQFILLAWRFGSETHEGQDGDIAGIGDQMPAEWAAFDPKSPDVLVIFTTNDGGDNFTAATLAPCGQAMRAPAR